MCSNIRLLDIKKNKRCIFKENDIDLILPGLYLGNLVASNNVKLLEKYNIKFIMRAQLEGGIQYSHINYLHVPIKDNMVNTIDTINLFDRTSNYIDAWLKQKNNNENILIHCKKGHHRSGTIIAAFMYSKLGLNYEQVIKYINNRRPCALRRDTQMMRELYKYYLNINNIYYKDIYLCDMYNVYLRYVTKNESTLLPE